MSNQTEKIKMLNKTINDLQMQIIAKDKQIAFLQGQIYNYHWIIKNTGTTEDYTVWGDDFGDYKSDDKSEYGDDFL